MNKYQECIEKLLGYCEQYLGPCICGSEMTEARALLDSPDYLIIHVLDHGYVQLLDYMGDDRAIADAARVSYNRAIDEGKPIDRLIDYMMRHRHTSPFEQVIFKFRIKLPIFVMRQLIRHRTASVNEISGRYAVLEDEYFMPQEWRGQSGKDKQSSEGLVDYDPNTCILTSEKISFQEYHDRLDAGVSKELARTCLPLSTYTQCIWTMDLHNLFHFLKLRLDSHAQPEIRVYAEAILSLIEPIVPIAVSSWRNHVLDAVTFSADELADMSVPTHRIQELIDKLKGWANNGRR